MTETKSIKWIKLAVVWSLAVIFGLTMASVFLWSQEQEQKPIMEKVTVTNVEVPVRVLHKALYSQGGFCKSPPGPRNTFYCTALVGGAHNLLHGPCRVRSY